MTCTSKFIESSADELNIKIDLNADFNLTLSLLNELNEPVDLTDYTAKLQIKYPGSNRLIIELSTENGRILITALSDIVLLHIDVEDLASITAAHGEYDLILIHPNITKKLLLGKVEFINGITK